MIIEIVIAILIVLVLIRIFPFIAMLFTVIVAFYFFTQNTVITIVVGILLCVIGAAGLALHIIDSNKRKKKEQVHLKDLAEQGLTVYDIKTRRPKN